MRIRYAVNDSAKGKIEYIALAFNWKLVLFTSYKFVGWFKFPTNDVDDFWKELNRNKSKKFVCIHDVIYLLYYIKFKISLKIRDLMIKKE